MRNVQVGSAIAVMLVVHLICGTCSCLQAFLRGQEYEHVRAELGHLVMQSRDGDARACLARVKQILSELSTNKDDDSGKETVAERKPTKSMR